VADNAHFATELEEPRFAILYLERQQVETLLKRLVLNRIAALEMPRSERVLAGDPLAGKGTVAHPYCATQLIDTSPRRTIRSEETA
jgi:hypothetical protein